jgi:hypothetical protein
MVGELGTSGPESMHSPQQISKSVSRRTGWNSPAPEKAGDSMAGSSPANFSNNRMYGFADILALLSSKTISELRTQRFWCNHARLTPTEETPLYYLAIIGTE